MIKQDVVSHDPTSKCLSDIDVRKFEMHVISDDRLSVFYTFTSNGDENETINKVIDCNRSVFLKSLEKYIVPSDIDFHIKRLENQLRFYQKLL